MFNRKRILVVFFACIVILISACASYRYNYKEGYYYHTVSRWSTIESSLESDIKIMLKYPRLIKQFGSLPVGPPEMKSYSISDPDSENQITITIDCSSNKQENIITKKIQLSDKYRHPIYDTLHKIQLIPQSMLDQYKSYLNARLNNPEFVARSNRLRNEIDAKIDAEIVQKEQDEAKAKQLGYASVDDYYRALKRQSSENFRAHIGYELGSFNSGIPFVKGDVFNIEKDSIAAVDRDDTPDGIMYLAKIWSYTYLPGRAFYIITDREFLFAPYSQYNLIYEPMKLKYIGTAQYTQGRVHTVNTWVFLRID
jgi:hypothetical protein